MQLNTMSHSALYLNQVAVAPGVLCKVEAKSLGKRSSLPTLTTGVNYLRKQLLVRKSTSCGAGKTNARKSCNSGGRQSNVIDAEPVDDTTSWRVDPTFSTAIGEELPGWQNVKKLISEVPPVTSAASLEETSRIISDCVQDTVDLVQFVEGGAVERSAESGSLGCDDTDSATSRSSRHVLERQKQPDMIRSRLFVEGVRIPSGYGSELNLVCRVSHHLQDVILFLESLDLDSTKLMTKYPLLSTCSVENVRAVVRFLESHKLRRKDVVKVLTNNPYLLVHSVEENFLPVVKFLLTEVGLKKRDVGKVLNRCARLLTASVDDRLRPTLHFLRSFGFIHMSIVVSNNATLLASNIENRLIPKIEFLKSLGFSKEETVQAFIRFPAIFNYSIESNLRPKYRFLKEEMGRGLDDLKAFPQYFGYSLECRIRPRYQFLKKRNISLPLAYLLKPTDEVFYARFQHELMQSCDKGPSCVV
ncbi:hypothetical protein KC19_VG310900 [Ceratodon purpureus]|uniref:Uncharacterized protein n=1 Tax=Ceratodon purpureus TaxID=3225 RepID=A0A8T0HVB0_CERPU|nr:hypothetical protein KC19_VG310900 [Ceratodon purpureus]KAG0575013.1 hypothetical protein KC19_VG310900 [Ceratodon purpureus]